MGDGQGTQAAGWLAGTASGGCGRAASSGGGTGPPRLPATAAGTATATATRTWAPKGPVVGRGSRQQG